MKILITILFLIISVVCFSQTINPYLGCPTCITYNHGYFESQRGVLASINYPDTTTANADPYLKNQPNIIITVNDTLWKRSNSAQYWSKIGSGSGNSNSIVTTIAQGYSEVAQGNSNYDALGTPVVNGDTIWVFFKSSPTHSVEGKFLVTRSINQNYSYDSTWQVTVNGIGDSTTNFEAGINNGRITIGWRSARGGTNTILFAYSDDGAKTWTSAGSYTASIQAFPFGIITQASNSILLAPFYTVGTADTSFLLGSSNNGVSWSLYDTVATGTPSLDYTETSVMLVGQDSLIGVVRSDLSNRPIQFKSIDNGHTWTRVGGLNLLQLSTQQAPVFIQPFNGRIWLTGALRDVDFSVFWYSNGLLKNVFSDTSAWSKRAAIYHPLADDAGSPIDMGYDFPLIFQSQLLVCGYDISPLQTSSGTKVTSQFTLPVIANGNFVKAYNNSNQSIANNTATIVTFPKIDMNDGLLYNTDSNFVIAVRDGWYQIKAVATYDTSSAGTYRQLYIFIASAAYSSGGTVKATQTIAKTTIAGHQSNFDFDRMECNAVYFVRKGEKIQVFTKQDSGGSLNLVNTNVDQMATLNIKRIE